MIPPDSYVGTHRTFLRVHCVASLSPAPSALFVLPLPTSLSAIYVGVSRSMDGCMCVFLYVLDHTVHYTQIPPELHETPQIFCYFGEYLKVFLIFVQDERFRSAPLYPAYQFATFITQMLSAHIFFTHFSFFFFLLTYLRKTSVTLFRGMF